MELTRLRPKVESEEDEKFDNTKWPTRDSTASKVAQSNQTKIETKLKFWLLRKFVKTAVSCDRRINNIGRN